MYLQWETKKHLPNFKENGLFIFWRKGEGRFSSLIEKLPAPPETPLHKLVIVIAISAKKWEQIEVLKLVEQ